MVELRLTRRCIVQWFQFIDTDNNGRVDAQELQRALSKGGLHFSLQTVARMIGYAPDAQCQRMMR
jgi:Ca2+-binding EF-hand superfamily protein